MTAYRIFPPIGVARVGDSTEKFYIGPETYRGLPINCDGSPFTEDDFRDAGGAMCRQAARFRIYRDTPSGPEEVTLNTPGVTAIRWTAHLANKKSSWYTFATNAGEFGYASNHPLRNAHVKDRQSLFIDFGPRSISGAGQGPNPFSAATVPPDYVGTSAPPSPLYPGPVTIDALGELHTDGDGRLLVVGGFGKSGSSKSPPKIVEYANNDDWWDDISDGPVAAEVHFSDGSCISAGTAWTVVAPPGYAPQIPNLVTLWDTIFDGAVRAGDYPQICAQGLWQAGPQGYRPNFRTEIGPLLERATLYPWVAAIPPKPHSFDMARLATVPHSHESDENRGLRSWILNVLRAPAAENLAFSASGRTMMPYLAGDNALQPNTLTSTYLRLTDTQYFFLQQWASGWFIDEPDCTPAPQALTRAVLENCVGGAFSPGIEMTWISRNRTIYQADDPLRINAFLPENGPLSTGYDPKRMEPGDLGRYMAVPWQADFNECSSQPIGDRTLWWWPSQRPEFVYLDPRIPLPLAAAVGGRGPEDTPHRQVAWIGTDFDQMRPDYIMFADDTQMVEYWAGLGFVLLKDFGEHYGPRYVEVARTLPRPFYPTS